MGAISFGGKSLLNLYFILTWLIALSGPFAILFGFILCYMGLSGHFQFTANLHGFEFALAGASPGLFLVLCGTIVIGFIFRSSFLKAMTELHILMLDAQVHDMYDHWIDVQGDTKKFRELTSVGMSGRFRQARWQDRGPKTLRFHFTLSDKKLNPDSVLNEIAHAGFKVLGGELKQIVPTTSPADSLKQV